VIFAASFLGVEAVAMSALLTLPFQAAVAIYFVGRHINLNLADLVLATKKSGIVTICSGTTIAICASVIDSGVIGPVLGIFVGFLMAAVAWLAAVLVVRHPLLVELRAPASQTLSAILRFVGFVPTTAERDFR
jgi:hypothetical protein